MTFLATATQVLADTASAATGIDPFAALAQLGIGALIAGPFAYLWRAGRADHQTAEAEWKKETAALTLAHSTAIAAKEATIAAKDKELRELREEMYRRERDLNDAALPRLADSVTTLRETQRGLSDALRTQGNPPGQDAMLADTARRLESVVSSLTDMIRRGT